jgi:hypothetical protein
MVSGGVEDIAARGANRIDEYAPQVTCDARAVMRGESVRFRSERTAMSAEPRSER